MHKNIPPYYPFAGQSCFLIGSTDLNDYLTGGFTDFSRDSKASIVLEKLINKYGIPECGTNRLGFISKYIVIKFPLNEKGEYENIFESTFKSPITAKTKLIYYLGFKIAIQEKLILSPIKEEYAWINLVDNRQVGYSKKLQLKAFDFANNYSLINETIKPLLPSF